MAKKVKSEKHELKGNIGEWSEPYVLLKLLAEGKLYLGDDNFERIKEVFYPVLTVLRQEKIRVLEFARKDNLIVINGDKQFSVPIIDFATNAKKCFDAIQRRKVSLRKKEVDDEDKGAFEIPELNDFLKSISINSLKEGEGAKNDIKIQIEDPKTFLSPTLGFSIKSQMGALAALVNASGVTNFTFDVVGTLTDEDIKRIKSTKKFSAKFQILNKLGIVLKFKTVDSPIFKSNLQTIDYYFGEMLARMLLIYYSTDGSEGNKVTNLVKKITKENFLNYDLKINSTIYEMHMKKFLTDYALGMRAKTVWKRVYEATGGYLIVKSDGEIICYHFYFAQQFENFLFNNTKFDTGSVTRHKFGEIYKGDEGLLMKLNLLIKFI